MTTTPPITVNAISSISNFILGSRERANAYSDPFQVRFIGIFSSGRRHITSSPHIKCSIFQLPHQQTSRRLFLVRFCECEHTGIGSTQLVD